jgi:hypothetical protein
MEAQTTDEIVRVPRDDDASFGAWRGRMYETQLRERLFDPAADAPQAAGTGRACSAVPATAHC